MMNMRDNFSKLQAVMFVIPELQLVHGFWNRRSKQPHVLFRQMELYSQPEIWLWEISCNFRWE